MEEILEKLQSIKTQMTNNQQAQKHFQMHIRDEINSIITAILNHRTDS